MKLAPLNTFGQADSARALRARQPCPLTSKEPDSVTTLFAEKEDRKLEIAIR